MSGLSQKNRKDRIGEAKKVAVIDNSIESLLLQAEEIARFLRYYNFSNQPDGYFDSFLHDLNAIRQKGSGSFTPNGNMEPSQALLLTFIRHLHNLTQQFNQRFKDLPGWYFSHFLKPKPLSPGRHKVCLLFRKNTNDPIFIGKEVGFTLKENKHQTFVYRLSEDTLIDNVSVENIYAFHFCKEKYIYPASYFNLVTSLRMKDLRDDASGEKMMFTFEDKSKHVKKFGFMLTSPSLLLREGQRHVNIRFEFEKPAHLQTFIKKFVDKVGATHDLSSESIRYLCFNNIFHLKMSTSEGWTVIENYRVNADKECLCVEFLLPEDFPPSTACTEDIHDFESKNPALRFILNIDAWLYPYSWMKRLFLEKVCIETEVNGLSNILVYNDLGRVDNSKPFNPFGINTEKGAWFTVGNYEMALKNTISVDLKIDWSHFISNEDGLYGHYRSYNNDIGNRSFKVLVRYLSGYHWKNDKTVYLFATEPSQSDNTPYPNAALSQTSDLRNISVENMPPVQVDEEHYEYNIYTHSGFISVSLVAPEMGFGEKCYRNLFSDHLINMSLKKKRKIPAPNPPVTPQVERLSMSYKSYDEIVFTKKDNDGSDMMFYHIFPFGNQLIYPSAGIAGVPLVYAMDTDANILLQLSGLRSGKLLRLYFDFSPLNKEIPDGEIPQIKWYLGDGNQWEQIPDDYIIEDNTQNLLGSGIVKINMPDSIKGSFFDKDGRIWLRIGIRAHEDMISCIREVHVNVGEAELRIDESVLKNEDLLHFTGELELENKIPGIERFQPLAFYGGRGKETHEEMCIRVSEFASHRGKAVTARDIERITLQEFPEIGKVKCLPHYNSKSDEKGVATLVVIPKSTNEDKKTYMPLANVRQILKIEFLLKERISAYMKNVDVINPLYEEILIRCKIKFERKNTTAACHATLQSLFNQLIAPWQDKRQLPDFDYCLNMEDIHRLLSEQIFIDRVCDLSVIQIVENKDGTYRICEYNDKTDVIKPSKPYAIFIPGKAHLILSTGQQAQTSDQFGVNEMIIHESLIVDKK